MTDDVTQQVEKKMRKSIESFQNELSKIRTGRPHPSFLERIQVDYYGVMTPLAQLANISVQDGRTLLLTVWEKKILPSVDRAIRESGLGLNPQASGDAIRVPMPPLSEERRRELAKIVGQQAEEARISLRNIRREANDQLKVQLKDKLISEDTSHRLQDDIQKTLDRFSAEVEAFRVAKEKEVMTVA